MLKNTIADLTKRNNFLESKLVKFELVKSESEKYRYNYCEILKACDFVKKELEAEKEMFKLWTTTSRRVHTILDNQSPISNCLFMIQ